MGSTVPEVEGDVSASARPKQTVGKVTIQTALEAAQTRAAMNTDHHSETEHQYAYRRCLLQGDKNI